MLRISTNKQNMFSLMHIINTLMTKLDYYNVMKEIK